MDVLIRLIICVSAVYVLVWLAGFYDDAMRWNHRRKLMKQWRARHGQEP